MASPLTSRIIAGRDDPCSALRSRNLRESTQLACFPTLFFFFSDCVSAVKSVSRSGDRLTLSEWGEAAFYAPDRIVALGGLWRHERGQFLRGPDGEIAYLRIGGRLWRRVP